MRAFLRRWFGQDVPHRQSVRDAFTKLPHLEEPELAKKMTRRQKWDRRAPKVEMHRLSLVQEQADRILRKQRTA
jgi:hypothetical protein